MQQSGVRMPFLSFQELVIERWSGRSGGGEELESQSGLGDKTDTCDGFYRDDVTWLEMGRLVKYESSDSISISLGRDGLILGTGKKCRRSYVCREKAPY